MSTTMSTIAAAADPALLLGVQQVSQICNLGQRTIWRLSASGGMPAPLRVAGRRLWRFDEVRRWVEGGCPRMARS